MKIVKRVLFVLLTILFCSNQLQAQNSLFDLQDLSQLKIDDLSDDQIIAAYKKAVESGITESQLFKTLAERGLPDTEIMRLRVRLQNLTSLKKSVSGNQLNEEKFDKVVHAYDTSGTNVPMQKFSNDQAIFGSELFTSNSLVFEPNLRIPAPAGYVLGPDDELVISVYGFSEKKYNLTINESGEIYIPNVGPIYLNGLSIEEASEKIKSKLAATIY